MIGKDFLYFIWNGGLDPILTNRHALRQRRTVSSMYLLMIPVLLVLLTVNLLLFTAPVENLHIAVMFFIGLFALYMQAYKGRSRLAALIMVAIFIVAPTSVIIQLGLTSVNWVWIFPSVVIANLILDRKAAIIAAIIGVSCVMSFGILTQQGRIAPDLNIITHPNAVALTGSLLIFVISAAGFFFRAIQYRDEARLQDQIMRLGKEVQIRREAEKEAQAGKRAKAVFLETISHELRTPLNGVIGAGQLLSGKASNHKEQELVDVVTNSGEILLDLINNVFDLSQLEAGDLTLHPMPMQVESTIKSAIAPLVISGREKGVKVDYHIEDDVPDYIVSDAVRLRQIVLNLCGNALKFTETGQIDIIVKRQGSRISLDIRDTGIGISKDIQEKLFQPFTQADSSTARLFGGSGLGLTIVYQLVQLFNGEIKVDSQPGSGSTFSVLLPLQECECPSSEADQERTILPSTAIKKITALVTDDNAVNRMVASRMLESLNCNIIEAADGFEALAALRNEKIDIVFMDVQMPNMDGLSATTHIRKMPGPAGKLPIVGLTANAMESDKSEMLAAGMNLYLSKPVRIEQLQDVLTIVKTADNPS